MLRHRKEIRSAMRGGRVSEAFRERLMLVVTEVNGCRYCRAFHSKEALRAGLSTEERDVYLQGLIPENAPKEEYPALLYARYWAENDGQADESTTQQLIEHYGEDTARDIITILRLIRLGNLMGNTWDYLLYWLSRGRIGLQERDLSDSQGSPPSNPTVPSL